MTIEQFNSPIWTGGMKARVLNNEIFTNEYDVVSVDFEDKTIKLEIGDICLDFSYSEIEVI